MRGRVIEQEKFGKGLVLIVLPALVGLIGKLWSSFSGHPADPKILFFVGLMFSFGSYLSWDLAKKDHILTWLRPVYRLSSALYCLMAIAFIAVAIFN